MTINQKWLALSVTLGAITLMSGSDVNADSFGTGFVFHPNGLILTTHRNVTLEADQDSDHPARKRCQSLEVKINGYLGKANTVAADEANNLAVIQINPKNFLATKQRNYSSNAQRASVSHTGWINFNVSQHNFRTAAQKTKNKLAGPLPYLKLAYFTPKPGSKISMFSYELYSRLSRTLKISNGIIAAPNGPDNDSSLLQISAAANDESSGAPVVNRRGEVVALHFGHFEAYFGTHNLKIAQGLNFAMKSQTIMQFLEINDLAFDDSYTQHHNSTTNLYEMAKKSVASIRCNASYFKPQTVSMR